MRFRATLELHGRTATGISVPSEYVASLGAGKRPPVRVRLGNCTYRTTVAPRGDDFLIPVRAEIRAAAGVAAGDEVDVEIEHDTEPREVTTPADLADALAGDVPARQFFDGLSYSNQRAYVLWIEDAKKAETRERRVAKAVTMLGAGQTRS